MNTLQDSQPEKARFPLARFFIIVLAQLALGFVLFRFVAPNLFADEMSRPWAIVLWTFLLALPLSLFEYLYHRYLLHSAVLPFLGSMHQAHTTHHKLTYIKASVRAVTPDQLAPVQSEYPILVEEQEEAMMFPLYSFSIFCAIFIVSLAIPLKLILPSAPVISSLLIAITFQYVAYEIWHMVLHLPFEKVWLPMMNKRFLHKTVRRVYSFHLMHHWRQSCNLAVVGFWGIALWDHVFRTHRRPERIR